MSRRLSALRAFKHQNPNATVEDAWHAAWDNQQGRVSSLKHQEKDAHIAQLQQENEALKAAINKAGAFMSQGATNAAIDTLSEALRDD